MFRNSIVQNIKDTYIVKDNLPFLNPCKVEYKYQYENHQLLVKI